MKSLSGEDGKLYALPFYGESSFLMYRKDMLKKKGITMPERPTWQQVADIAAKVDGAEPGMKGICLRGLPGWGEHVRPADHGGQHLRRHLVHQGLEAAGRLARSSSRPPTSTSTWSRQHGEPGASQAGFTECLNAMSQSKVAMWYDATSAAGSLEDPSVSARSPARSATCRPRS